MNESTVTKKNWIGLQFFAEPGEEPEGGSAEMPEDEPTPPTESEELRRLKDELARQKAATDKASKEAAAYKKQLRANQTAEEQRAEEEKERQATRDAELESLKKEMAISKSSKAAMAFAGDEATADAIAAAVYGAEDPDTLFDLFDKILTAREKKLKVEYGKTPAPAAGDGAPSVSKEEIENMTYKARLEFRNEYPDTYQKLMQ